MRENTAFYFDMDGVLANFHEHKDGWKFARGYKFIRELRPFMETVDLVNDLIAGGNDVYISSLCASEDAKRGKIDWLGQYIPALDIDHIIIIVGNGKKHENMRTANGILIDDKLANVRASRKAGMKAVFVEEKGKVDLTTMA